MVTRNSCFQHHVPPQPERCPLPDVCSKSAADACGGPREKAAGLWREPVSLLGKHCCTVSCVRVTGGSGDLTNFVCYSHDWANLTQGSIRDYFRPLHRNMMVESARFSHGQGMMQMQDLSKLDVNSFDAVIFPGGQGIIKNLWGIMCSFKQSQAKYSAGRHEEDGALILVLLSTLQILFCEGRQRLQAAQWCGKGAERIPPFKQAYWVCIICSLFNLSVLKDQYCATLIIITSF